MAGPSAPVNTKLPLKETDAPQEVISVAPSAPEAPVSVEALTPPDQPAPILPAEANLAAWVSAEFYKNKGGAYELDPVTGVKRPVAS